MEKGKLLTGNSNGELIIYDLTRTPFVKYDEAISRYDSLVENISGASRLEKGPLNKLNKNEVRKLEQTINELDTLNSKIKKATVKIKDSKYTLRHISLNKDYIITGSCKRIDDWKEFDMVNTYDINTLVKKNTKQLPQSEEIKKIYVTYPHLIIATENIHDDKYNNKIFIYDTKNLNLIREFKNKELVFCSDDFLITKTQIKEAVYYEFGSLREPAQYVYTLYDNKTLEGKVIGKPQIGWPDLKFEVEASHWFSDEREKYTPNDGLSRACSAGFITVSDRQTKKKIYESNHLYASHWLITDNKLIYAYGGKENDGKSALIDIINLNSLEKETIFTRSLSRITSLALIS